MYISWWSTTTKTINNQNKKNKNKKSRALGKSQINFFTQRDEGKKNDTKGKCEERETGEKEREGEKEVGTSTGYIKKERDELTIDNFNFIYLQVILL